METRVFEFQIDGTVSLEVFIASIEAWNSMLKNAKNIVGREFVGETRIESLQTGSAIVTTLTEFNTVLVADHFDALVRGTAQHASGNLESPLPKRMDAPVRKIRQLAKTLPASEGLVIRTPDADFLIRDSQEDLGSTVVPKIGGHSIETIGVISGKLESISSRQGLKAVIYDDVFDRAVRLNLDASWHDRVQKLWSGNVTATGTIRRDPATGRPLSVHELRQIDPVDVSDDRWDWKLARGVLKNMAPGVKSEDLIRSAWDE